MNLMNSLWQYQKIIPVLLFIFCGFCIQNGLFFEVSPIGFHRVVTLSKFQIWWKQSLILVIITDDIIYEPM